MDTEMPIQRGSINVDRIITPLTPQHFYQSDPWLVFVKSKLHLDNSLNTALFFVLAMLMNFCYALISKDINQTSFLEVLYLFAFSVANTSFYLIYLLLPQFMAETFNTLSANEVIGNPRQTSSSHTSYEDFVRGLLDWANKKRWFATIVMIPVPIGLGLVLILHPRIPLFRDVLYFLVGIIPAIYIICFILVRIVLLLMFVNQLFTTFTLHVKPLHSDGSGGLGSLGHLAKISIGMVFAISLAILSDPQSLANPEGIILATTLYFFFSLALVTGWLAIPHHWMLLARQEFLQDITNEYEQAVQETKPSLISFSALLMRGEFLICRAPKRSIGLERKVLAREATGLPC